MDGPQGPSEKRPYRSRFANDLFVTAAQFLAEGMLARKARKDGVTLPERFWLLDRHKRDFAKEVRVALQLLKLYPAEAVLAALRSPGGKGAWTLGAPWLDALIRAEAARLKRREEDKATLLPPPPPSGVPEPPRPAFVVKKSTLGKLKGL